MAQCEQGYLCDVCGLEVEAITESDLYLRYVLGEVPPLSLPTQRRTAHPLQSGHGSVHRGSRVWGGRCEGMFAKEHLDAAFVAEEERRVTRGWRRLQEIPTLGVAIPDYPLPEVLAAWRGENPSLG